MGKLDISLKRRGRSPVVAGLFYPDEKSAVEARLCSYGLESGTGGRAAAIIAPHGAWDLSGAVAGAAFSAAAGRAKKRADGSGVSRVVILGNIYNTGEEGIFFSDSHFFDTPLGRLPVDQYLCESLASCSTLFEINDIPHLRETSVEVLLPLVRFCFPGAAIVPILMGGVHPRLVLTLGRALGIILEPLMDNTLLVISANLSLNNDKNKAYSQATDCIQLLEEKKKSEFISGVFNGQISACGGPLIASLLESGLMDGKDARLVSGSLVTARNEQGKTTCYGGIAFE
jgi:AmmeMemoRadiSam system protein B